MKKLWKCLLVMATLAVLSLDVMCFAQEADAQNAGVGVVRQDNLIGRALDDQGMDFPVIRIGSVDWHIRQAKPLARGGWFYLYSFSTKGDGAVGKRRLEIFADADLGAKQQDKIADLLQMRIGTHVGMERSTDGYQYIFGQHYKQSDICVGEITSPFGVKAFYVVDNCNFSNELAKFIKIKFEPAGSFPKRELNKVRGDYTLDTGSTRHQVREDTRREKAQAKAEAKVQAKAAKAEAKAQAKQKEPVRTRK